MSVPSPSRTLAMLAGVLVLAAGAAHAETQPAAKDGGRKAAKPSHEASAAPSTGHHPGDKSAAKEASEPDMIMLQEPFRPGPAMPVNATRGR